MKIEELEVTLPFNVCRDREAAIRRLREFVPLPLLERYDAMTQLPLTDDDPPALGEYGGCKIWVMCNPYGYSLTFQPVSGSSWSLEQAVALDEKLKLSERLKDGLEIHAVVGGKLSEDAYKEQQANRTNGLPWSHGLNALKK